ncbi:MAG TPA: YggS family pyridoxal phosphate-dependent enzyme [Gemmatimonadales bacterium]|nr:YggS family pyridoxal phosphate-dependent enzyme [Gemmatimonadales bacterium]
MPEPAFQDRLNRVREAIEAARSTGGWSHPVRIVAVTKTHGAEAVRMAALAGLDAVGENRVQEALAKQEVTAGVAIEWHLIGSLQRNKARHAAGRFELIHSVDRFDLATELDRRMPAGSVQRVLVQVNCSAEPQKGGVEPGELPALLDQLRPLERIRAEGLMTMAALDATESEARRSFAQLRKLAEAGRRAGHQLGELSMGMSGDFEWAVAEGSTMVRLGTILFGARPIQ